MSNHAHEPEESVNRLVAVLERLPGWITAAAFFVLAVAFALSGKLDDWFRALAAVAFVALALANLHRWEAKHPAPPPDPTSMAPVPPSESPPSAPAHPPAPS